VTVLAHNEVTLYKGAEGSIEVKSTCLAIIEELVLGAEPHVSRSAVTFSNDLLKIRGDRVGEPAEDDDVHPGPPRIVGEGIIGLDVVGKGVSYQGHQHEITPEGVVRGRGVQNDVHQLANIRNCSRLDVEVADDGRVVGGAIGRVGRCQGRRGWR
jgi:hypothetical protein